MKIFSRFLCFLTLFSVCANTSYAQTDEVEITLWESVKDSKDRAEFEAFLESFPNGKFAPLAKVRLKSLTSPTAPADGFEDEVENNRPAASDLTAPDASAPHDCDRHAAHPDDPKRVSKGVPNNLISVNKAIIACRRAAAQFPNEPRFKYQLGRALYEKKMFGEAAKLFTEGIDADYPMSMAALAFMHLQGQGTKKSSRRAFNLFIKAAESGISSAMVHVGHCYSTGNGVEQDPKKAREWFLKSTESGSPTGLVELAAIY